ncbi:MAG: hypothetical protein IPM47_12375 [Sphingobacteriales bacterium]|nr:MAG: hypothetical protein IPM47_12375 [Sphingobacteriales bacterium]
MPYANLRIAFPEADYLLAKNDFDHLKSRLPFVINLTPAEKSGYLRLGGKAMMFVRKSLQFYTDNPALQTGYVSLTEWKNDWETMERLEMLLLQVNVLQEALQDTVTALKMENMSSALSFYNILKNAAQQNVPGTDNILSQLKEMMPGAHRKKTKPAEAKAENPQLNADETGS